MTRCCFASNLGAIFAPVDSRWNLPSRRTAPFSASATPRVHWSALTVDEWFPLSQAVVAYDHARHAPLGDVITLDVINTGLEPGARAGIELTLETAKELRAALDRAIAAAEFEEAEVRGKGATCYW